MNFGARVKKAREEKGLSQVELAEKLGIANTMISRIESGGKIPSLLLSVKIAEQLGKPLDELTSD